MLVDTVVEFDGVPDVVTMLVNGTLGPPAFKSPACVVAVVAELHEAKTAILTNKMPHANRIFLIILSPLNYSSIYIYGIVGACITIII